MGQTGNEKMDVVLLAPGKMKGRQIEKWAGALCKAAPWVETIYVTGWERPEDFPETDRLRWAAREDYLSGEFQESRNPCTLMLNLHRISGLSNCFLFFQKPFLPARAWKEEMFFRKGIPVDFFSLKPVVFREGTDDKICVMCMEAINGSFRVRSGLREKGKLWFSPKNGKRNVLRSLTMVNQYWFPGFRDRTGPLPLRKETFEQVWEKEEEFLTSFCLHKHREDWEADIRLLRYWQLASGNFCPERETVLKRLYRNRP